MNTIAILNQKGGVGKTTSTINIAGELSLRGKKVLIIDGDSQGNSTQNLGMYNPDNLTISNVLLGEKSINDVILHTAFENIDLVPANLRLQYAEMSLQQRVTRNDNVLKKAMSELRTSYDYIIVDCPPSLSTMTVNILTYVENVLVPVKTDRNSLEGYESLLDMVNAIRQDSNENLKILGLFITVFEKQTVLDRKIFEDVQNGIGNLFINVPIRKCIEVREAPMSALPVCYYSNTSNGTEDYRNLTTAIIERLGENK